METHWWMEAKIYEVYVDKFAGTFAKMARRLDYLEKLGINCIWILPHYSSPMIDGGYDVSDYCSVRSDLGTLSDFDDFVNAAHARGMRVIIDLVLNHTSTEHPWFANARDYYIWSDPDRELLDAVNPFAHIKPSNWIFNENAGQYYFASFYPQQADLNWANPAVEIEMMEIMDFWLRRGVDGFRLDAVSFLGKREGTDCLNLPSAHGVVRKLRAHLQKYYPEAILLGEATGPEKTAREYFGNGDECHLVFNFYLMTQLFLNRLAYVGNNLPANCQWATFLTNHDAIDFRYLTPAEKQIIINHLDPSGDYMINGTAIAKRLGSIFYDDSRIVELFRALCSFSGTPVIYYGEEIGMKNLSINPAPVDKRSYVRGSFDWNTAISQTKTHDSTFSGISRVLHSITK